MGTVLSLRRTVLSNCCRCWRSLRIRGRRAYWWRPHPVESSPPPLPTHRAWRWTLQLNIGASAGDLAALRESIRSQPASTRIGLALLQLGVLALVSYGSVLALRLSPALASQRLEGIAVLTGFCVLVVGAAGLGMGAGAVLVAWVARRFQLLPEPALEYLLRRGPF